MVAQLRALGSSIVDSWSLGDVFVFFYSSMHFYSRDLGIERFDVGIVYVKSKLNICSA
jgi:hypothetical protein